MEDLIKLVSKRVGITPAQAKKAVQVVWEFLQEKLPAPIATIVGKFLGEGGTVSQADDLLQSLGQFLSALGGAKPAKAKRPARKRARKQKPKGRPTARPAAKPRPRPATTPTAKPKRRAKPKPRPKAARRREPAKQPSPGARKKTGTG